MTSGLITVNRCNRQIMSQYKIQVQKCTPTPDSQLANTSLSLYLKNLDRKHRLHWQNNMQCTTTHINLLWEPFVIHVYAFLPLNAMCGVV